MDTSVAFCQAEQPYSYRKQLHRYQYKNLLNELKNSTPDLRILGPKYNNPEERRRKWAGPAVNGKVNGTFNVLER